MESWANLLWLMAALLLINEVKLRLSKNLLRCMDCVLALGLVFLFTALQSTFSSSGPVGWMTLSAFVGAGLLAVSGCRLFWPQENLYTTLSLGHGFERKYIALAMLIGVGAPLANISEVPKLHEAIKPTIALVLLSVFAAPLIEEILFRGVLFARLRKIASPSWSIVVAAAAFALFHPRETWSSVFLLGLVVGLIRERTQGLKGPVLAHAFHNACVISCTLLLA